MNSLLDPMISLVVISFYAFLYGFSMKLSDMISSEHNLLLYKNKISNFFVKVLISIIVGLLWVIIFNYSKELGYIFIFYIISYIFRKKIDDFNHFLTFIIMGVGIIHNYSFHPLEFSLLSVLLVIFYFIYPLIFGFYAHDKKINKLVAIGRRKDIKIDKSKNNKNIDVYEVMKSELPHSLFVYLLPAVIFFLLFPILKLEGSHLDIIILSSITAFILGYEIARLICTRKLKEGGFLQV